MIWTWLLNWRVWAVLGVALCVGMVTLQTHRLHAEQARYAGLKADYAAFVAGVKQAGEKAQKEAQAKEKQYEEAISTAMDQWRDERNRLRQFSQRPGGGGLSEVARPTQGNSAVCPETKLYYDALRGARGIINSCLAECRGIAAEGAAAQADAEGLLASWPK